MDSFTDNALMLKVKSGDLDKLGHLFKRYGRSLYGFYFRFTRDPELSEDLVQDVFERVLKYRHTYRGDGKFITWLYHLARNVLVDYHKRAARLGIREDIGKKEEALPDTAALGEATEKEADLKLMELALDHLSEEKKELLLLTKFQGLKYKDIATIYNCSEANVKVKVFRAVQDLREAFRKIQAKGISI
ncbi:RNA polymerase sigma factor [Pontibacter sp. SGAir0037]|uniref:RNA polymerase sigma factor n=1 Tax=Pontibacter sp. SGAir0037 TaxID=2571030 RepID=UPI0010CCF8F3|nr:RNA polymerase sigma factor [Pontibacter sp. SGAir0037]QCR22585.1 RNA polymerase sigma factor [Pontibacter sp. SGAir0037]